MYVEKLCDILLSDQVMWWLLFGLCSAVCDCHNHHDSDSHEQAADAERVCLHKDDTNLHMLSCVNRICANSKSYVRQ
jgi:hypothetical protein